MPESIPPPAEADNPCLSCGACCAAFVVPFYWGEAQARGLPDALVQRLDPWRSCMAGTNAKAPHCAALDGRVGQAVRCTVHPQRPTPCREVEPGCEQCGRARARYGLPPLTVR